MDSPIKSGNDNLLESFLVLRYNPVMFCTSTRHFTKMAHAGAFVAEVDVELIYTDEGWSPYLSLEDAYRLDDAREALRQGDMQSAARLARVYTLLRDAVTKSQLKTLGPFIFRGSHG